MATGPTRTPFTREQQLVIIAARYAEGRSQEVIAKELGVSRPQISYDLKTIRQRWLDAANRSITDKVAKELLKLDHLETTAWDAWERSTRPKETRRSTNQDAPQGTTATTQDTTAYQVGNPAFLERISWCIDRRCKLLGLDAPRQIDLQAELRTRAIEAARRYGISEADAIEAVATLLEAG